MSSSPTSPADPAQPLFPPLVPTQIVALRRGEAGPAVQTLQHRLISTGADLSGETGDYGEATELAVRNFQRSRGLRIDGICGPQTWSALVESGLRLGDRLLYLHRPVQRGDDVSDLQRRLSALGFYAGKVDGLFGVDTSDALAAFQRAAGLAADGIGGPATLAALARLGRRDGVEIQPAPVATIRERERLRRAPRDIAGRQVALGQPGGLDALLGAVSRSLSARGALVVVLPAVDDPEQAAAANTCGADIYLGLCLEPETTGCEVAYWSSPQGGASEGGRHLAQLLAPAIASALDDGGAAECLPMTLPVLRETRMAAVVCGFGPMVVPRAAAVADAVADGVEAWFADPCGEPSTL